MAQMMEFESMAFQPDSVKPPSAILDAWTNLEDIILREIREEPATATEVLARITSQASAELQQVTDYLRSNSFVKSSVPGVPVLFYILRINPLTGRGERASLGKGGKKAVLKYFPGYTLETPMIQFLMQELPNPLTKVDKAGRTLDSRRINADIIMRSFTTAIKRYERANTKKLGVNVRDMTVGRFFSLPQDVIRYFPNVYQLLRRYEFTREKV